MFRNVQRSAVNMNDSRMHTEKGRNIHFGVFFARRFRTPECEWSVLVAGGWEDDACLMSADHGCVSDLCSLLEVRWDRH
jgi:hypothetical protein